MLLRALSVALPILLGLLLRSPQPKPVPAAPASPHLAYGMPTPAVADLAHKNDYLLVRPQFALSWNDAKGTPNWVAWRLTAADIGKAPRKPFTTDPLLPAGLKRVTPGDYTAAGFDRGHQCPHEDRSATDADSAATFVMTNMVPQAPELNEQAWAAFEDYCRALARAGKVLYVIAGPAGVGGTGRNGPAKSLAGGKVTVPAYCWKVVLVTAGGKPESVLAVVMPNDRSPATHEWQKYQTTVGKVERLTGYQFFVGPLLKEKP